MATQRLDALGHVLRTLAFEDTCPFCEAVRQYTRIIVGPLDVGELRRLIFHLQLQSENGNMGDMDFDEVIDNIRTLSCSLACQITWRAIWLFQGRPYTAVLIVDARLSPAEQLSVCEDIHGSNPCDLDPWFLRKARSYLNNHINLNATLPLHPAPISKTFCTKKRQIHVWNYGNDQNGFQ